MHGANMKILNSLCLCLQLYAPKFMLLRHIVRSVSRREVTGWTTRFHQKKGGVFSSPLTRLDLSGFQLPLLQEAGCLVARVN